MDIKLIRKSLGATQSQFAEELGIDRTLLSKYETGAAPIPPYIRKAVDSIYVIDEDGTYIFVDRKKKQEADIEILQLKKKIASLEKENISLKEEVKKMDDVFDEVAGRRRRASRNPLPGIEGAS